MNLLENTPKNSIIFEDNRVMIALAYEPITKGHCVVIWKTGEEDICKLSIEDYEYLMDVVDVTRDSLREFYNLEKVYLMYLDEVNWVHWHLIPRYDEKGFNILKHKPERINVFEDTQELAEKFKKYYQKIILEKN